jgi:hypothetical protein
MLNDLTTAHPSPGAPAFDERAGTFPLSGEGN